MTSSSPVPVPSATRGERTILREGDLRASGTLMRARERELIGAKVAHEIKNPLTGVKALVQLGLRNPAEAASHPRLAIVEREIARMQQILQRYLSCTRALEEVAPVRVGLGSIVADTLRLLSARAADGGVRLCARGDVTIEADPRRLEEALLNLVANAIEATPPGGEVVIEVRGAGDEAEIAVRDSGHGMGAQVLRRLGTPFFTTRAGGTGLGVTLAGAVVARHGGTLRYESAPGKGTTATARFPRRAHRAEGDARGAFVGHRPVIR